MENQDSVENYNPFEKKKKTIGEKIATPAAKQVKLSSDTVDKDMKEASNVTPTNGKPHETDKRNKATMIPPLSNAPKGENVLPTGSNKTLQILLASFFAHCGDFAEAIVESTTTGNIRDLYASLYKHLTTINNFMDSSKNCYQKEEIIQKAWTTAKSPSTVQAGAGQNKAPSTPTIQVEVKYEPLTCAKCTKQFSSKFCLSRHQKTCTLPSDQLKKEAHCQFCNKDFTRPEYLKKHNVICKARSRMEDDEGIQNKISQAGQFFSLFNPNNSLPISALKKN